MNKIQLLVMDVDGTLTDGTIYMGKEEEMMKAFHVTDGYAIRDMLPAYGIKTGIITGRSSRIVENRAKELHVNFVYQNIQNKSAALMELLHECGVKVENTAFIGDDLPDLECIRLCGFSACPHDAEERIRKEVDYVCKKGGGRGAVREFAEVLIEAQGRMQEQ